ncbi:MAG TPA: hypothetical protein VF873_04130 [Gemmatimonadales bacterium]
MNLEGAVVGARLSAGYLGGGLIVALLPALGLEALPVAPAVKHGIAGALALGIVTAAGAGWARAMGTRVTGCADSQRLAWAGGLAYGPAVIAIGAVLGATEPALVTRGAILGAPIHIVFMAVFATAVFCVASIAGAGVGVGLRDSGLAMRLAGAPGVAAAAAFLLVALVMDTAGWRVGAPNAAKRATMLTVTALGVLAAAAAGGAAIGILIAARRTAPKPEIP